MRWFRAHTEAPRLLSLSPLRGEEDVDGSTLRLRPVSRFRDMSPVRWARRKSSSSESERNCYNVQTSEVTTERSVNKKDKKRIQEERRKTCEKRNPLLDRVKNTRLSFFRDKDSDDEAEDLDHVQFRSMNELSQRPIIRSELRRSVCEIDLKEISEEEKIHSKRKRRSKSQTRLPRKHSEERSTFFGFRTSTTQKCQSTDDVFEETPKPNRRWYKSKDAINDSSSRKSIDLLADEDTESCKERLRFDSVTPSSCLAAKFRAMQDRYLKSSTSRLIVKICKKDSDIKEGRTRRSFSYGTLPGLEMLRTNPIYEDHDQDDNDSGILDNDSATSSLLDDRCSSSASGLLASGSNEATPPLIPPRRPSAPITEAEKKAHLTGSLELNSLIADNIRHNSLSSLIAQNVRLGIERDPMNSVCQATNNELIQRQIRLGSKEKRAQSMNRKETDKQLTNGENQSSDSTLLPVVRNRSYSAESMVVKLQRNEADQSLGIFIAKTLETNPGYLVAHVVPNGLADKEGTLKIGDEILIVNGKRLKGLNMAEARKVLSSGSGPGEVDIVISRLTSTDQPRKLRESSVDYENVSMENSHGIIVEAASPRSHFRKHNSKRHRDRKNDSTRSISSEKSSPTSDSGSQSVSNFCTLPRRPRSTVSTFHTVVFQKGPGKKSLGFTIVGGRDSPKGSIGIFIKSVLPGGQAAEDGRLRAGDEVLAVNGQVCHDLAHKEAVRLFRNIKSGAVALHLCRRNKHREIQILKAKSCADLLLADS